jgi:hypothetical protein
MTDWVSKKPLREREARTWLSGMPMTEEQIIADAIEAGVDIELLEFNLSLTPEQRAYQHDRALKLVLELKKLGEEMRAHAGATA